MEKRYRFQQMVPGQSPEPKPNKNSVGFLHMISHWKGLQTWMKPMGKKYRRKSAELRARQGTLRLIPESTHVHASKVMLKILQARLQQYMNHELPSVQGRFRKGRGTRYQIANIRWIIDKATEFQKNSLLYWLCQSLWLCGSQSTVENSERDGSPRPPDLPLEKSVCRSGSNS